MAGPLLLARKGRSGCAGALAPLLGTGTSARSTAGGWESLGDIGRADADGYVYITDPLTDMILIGGANVYPAEIEAALDEHPAVRSSCVIGLPHEDLGNFPHAIAELSEPVADEHLIAHLRQRLAPHKLPRVIERATTPLRDDAGKVRRPALRAERIAQHPATQPPSKTAKPAQRQAHAVLMRPIWLEHPSRDVQRFISQLANGGQQACIRQTQNWLIWRHYPAGKRLVPHRKYSATGILESGRYPPHCVISRRLEQRARRPADLYFRKRPSIEGYCRTDRGNRRVVTVAHTVQRTAPDGATAESEVSAAL